MLHQVLEFKPITWSYADYNNRRYVLIEVDSSSDEYTEIASVFASYTVEKIERIQNPYALGCYLIRKEQLAARGQIVSEMRCYHPLNNFNEKNAALEFNLDVRRYRVNGKDPQFYSRIDNIIKQFDTFIVCKVLNVSQYMTHMTCYTVNYESEYVAEYVVNISKA